MQLQIPLQTQLPMPQPMPPLIAQQILPIALAIALVIALAIVQPIPLLILRFRQFVIVIADYVILPIVLNAILDTICLQIYHVKYALQIVLTATLLLALPV